MAVRYIPKYSAITIFFGLFVSFASGFLVALLFLTKVETCVASQTEGLTNQRTDADHIIGQDPKHFLSKIVAEIATATAKAVALELQSTAVNLSPDRNVSSPDMKYMPGGQTLPPGAIHEASKISMEGGNSYAFKFTSGVSTTNNQSMSQYTQEQAQRAKGREYPQQEMIREDFKHMGDLMRCFSSKFDELRSMPGLELGARSGWGTNHIREIGWRKMIGVELSADAVKFAQSKGRPVERGDMHQLKYSNCSQGILFSRHSLEHSLDYMQVLREAYRVLVPGGFANFVIPIEPEAGHALHTQQFFNDGTLVKGMIDVGFVVVSSEVMLTRMGPPFPSRRDMKDAETYEQRVLGHKLIC